MEPNRYWFLYFGLLFIFLGSRVGRILCGHVSMLFRAGMYLVLALLTAALAKILLGLSGFLLKIANKMEGEDGAEAKSVEEGGEKERG